MDIRTEELLALLDYYFNPNLPVLSGNQAQILVGIEMPSAVLAKGIDLHHSIRRPMFRELFRVSGPNSHETRNSLETNPSINHGKILTKAASIDDAGPLILGWLRTKMGEILGLPFEDINPERPPHTYGIDSLVAVDLRNWFSRELGADVELFLLLGNSSVEQIAFEAAKCSRHINDS
ncbi:hypothetical protein F4808DRAFT_473748 [Astrocystis sublimbata]|nr:hypothetical protein F4808DRAFT_473748 [Astrocystis sublimbata]